MAVSKVEKKIGVLKVGRVVFSRVERVETCRGRELEL